MKQTLQQQIAELTEKHNLQESVNNALPNFKTLTHPAFYKKRGTKYNVYIDLLETPLTEIAEKIQFILSAYPATKNNFLGFAGKDDLQTASPYVLRFKNEVRDNYAEIEYTSGDYYITIKVPVKFYSDDVKSMYYRKVTDCEYHYFTGMDINKILKIELRAFGMDMFEKQKYFGGDNVCYITDMEDKEEFESVLFKGHTPEFVEFWQKQLATL